MDLIVERDPTAKLCGDGFELSTFIRAGNILVG